ncbi:peptidylprolyl isomerase [Paractinoplanes maris]|uniref:peptidylprolyl isomerase n=1 Tax=Paractinoplanes maris TaxID=1734446 RepID=UPI0020205C44|nr:peptidylprolyl isomerase [Actinoplanes maris]
MSSIKDRQRAAARARLEKEMAERSAAARKRRQRQAVIGSAIAVVLIAGAAVWIATALRDDKSSDTPAAAGSSGAPVPAGQVACTWTPDPGGGGKVKDVGTPPPTAANTGSAVMTIDTNLGAVKATLDKTKVPCTAASFEFLASKKFWDNTKCHRMVNQASFKVLQCGDPFASGKGYRETDGQGGPSYTMAEENLPTDANNPYPAGSIAMANTGQPGSTGSQFFICSEDTKLPASYTLLGKITTGLDIVQKVVKAGDDGAFEPQPGGGHPKTEFDIKSIKVAAA